MRPEYSDPKEEHRALVLSLLGKSSQDPLPADFHKQRERQRKLTKSGQVDVDVSLLESPRVCKSFLVGKCPYEMLGNTKENMGKCHKIHIEKYKLIYESAIENGIKMPRHNYEIDYVNDLKYFLQDCDARIRLAQERLDYTPANKIMLMDLMKKVEESVRRIELTEEELQIVQNEQQDILKSIKINETLREYILQRDKAEKQYSVTLERLNSVGQQKMQICEVCGAYMLKDDSDRRLVDHFMGRIHLAYAEIRTTLTELEKKLDRDGHAATIQA